MAVPSDISAVAYNYSYEYYKLHQAHNAHLINDKAIEAYCYHYPHLRDETALSFSDVKEQLVTQAWGHTIGIIKLSSIRNLRKHKGGSLSLVEMCQTTPDPRGSYYRGMQCVSEVFSRPAHPQSIRWTAHGNSLPATCPLSGDFSTLAKRMPRKPRWKPPSWYFCVLYDCISSINPNQL